MKKVLLLSLLTASCGGPLVTDPAGERTSTDATSQFPWYFAIHAGEVRYDLVRAEKVFEEAVALGGRGVRTDVFWFDVEPSRNQWKASKMDFYSDYVDLAREHDLDVLVILSGAPDWAKQLYLASPEEFWKEYDEYVGTVVSTLAHRVDRWQLWNEANHIIDPILPGDEWQLFSRAGSLVHALDPGAQTFVNVFCDIPGWGEAVTSWVDRAGDEIDVIGIDHYPGTWACCSYTDWAPLDSLIERINTPGDAWYGKQGAILETGYSTWAYWIADEVDGKRWIEESMPVIRSKISQANARHANKIVLGSYYQLVDVESEGWGQEAHFGIVRSDLSPKAGYEEMQEQIASF